MQDLSDPVQFLKSIEPGMLIRYGLEFVTAVVILVVGLIVAKLVERLIRRSLERTSRVDVTLSRFLAKAANYAILSLVLIMVLAQFGIQTTSIIAALGAVGIAIGLALQGTLSNVAAGIMLLAFRPFKIGDYIDASGVEGTVQEIGLFITELKSADGVYRVAPNRQLWDTAIINYSRNPSRRVEIAVGIDYGDDVDKACALLMDLAAKEKRFLGDPAPMTFVKSLDDSAVTIALRAWTRTDDYWSVLWDMTRAAKVACDEAGISIPFPQRDVHVYPHGGVVAGVE